MNPNQPKSDTDHVANPPVKNPAPAGEAGPNDTVQGKPQNVPGEPRKTGGGPDPLQTIVRNPNQDVKLNQDFAQNRTDDAPGIQGTVQSGSPGIQGKT